MTVSPQKGAGSPVQRSSGGGLADVVDLILDKGLVIDAFVRVSLVGIELITIDARIVVASVDTYLRFAEATNRLDLYDKGGKGLPDLVQGMTGGGGPKEVEGESQEALDAGGGTDALDRGGEEEEERFEEEVREPRRRPSHEERER